MGREADTGTLNRRSDWRQLFDRFPKPNLGAAVTRFPVSSLGAAVTTIVLLALTEIDADPDTGATMARTGASFFAAAIIALAAVLFAERRGWAVQSRHALALAMGLCVGLLVWFASQVNMQPLAFYPALLLLAGLAPFATRRAENASYWMFNHDLWLGFAYGVIAAILVGGGVSAILATLQYLFQIKVPSSLWAETWIVATFLVAPLVWLSTIPTRFNAVDDRAAATTAGVSDRVDARTNDRTYDTVVFSGIALLVQYILVPLLLVYAAILYVYAAKILLQFELPKGQIGWMVSSFGVAGVLTALLGWPLRDTGGIMVRFFWRYWFIILIVPLALLGIGTYERIETYGLTQSRYALLLVGIWLALLAVIYLRPQAKRDLRWIAGSLCALLLAASIGPQSLTALPGRMLAAEFERTLTAAGYIKDGQIIEAAARTKALPEVASVRLYSVVRELRDTGQLGRLTMLFDNKAQSEIFDKTASKTLGDWPFGRAYTYQTLSALAKDLGLQPSTEKQNPKMASFDFLRTRLAKADATWVLGPVDSYFSVEDTWRIGEAPEIAIRRRGTSATLSIDGQKIAEFDLADLADGLFAPNSNPNASVSDAENKTPHVVNADGVTIILHSANFERQTLDAPAELRRLRFIALIPIAKFPDLQASQ